MLSTFCRNVFCPLVLRLVLAAIFLYHGLEKVAGPDKGWGAAWMPGDNALPSTTQLAVAWGELLGGAAMLFGFLTRLAALGLIALMAGAIATVHGQHGFALPHGYEYNVAIIGMCVCLVLGGAGPLSVDRFFRRKARQN
jgi:putative oxidoreductase